MTYFSFPYIIIYIVVSRNQIKLIKFYFWSLLTNMKNVTIMRHTFRNNELNMLRTSEIWYGQYENIRTMRISNTAPNDTSKNEKYFKKIGVSVCL